jgi:hypothetical protein
MPQQRDYFEQSLFRRLGVKGLFAWGYRGCGHG